MCGYGGMLNAVSAINMYSRQLDRLQKVVADDPQVKRETEYFLSKIASVKSADDLVKDTRLLTVATKAFGLSDMAYAKALLVKMMNGGLADSGSMANTMVDRRFKAFVETFNFGDLGEFATSFSGRMTNVAEAYKRQVLEDRAGEANPAARLALYFQRKAPDLRGGIDFLADKALTQFVQTALNLPTAPVSSDEALQAAVNRIEEKVDFADIKTPAGIEKMISRFAAMWEMKNPSQATTQTPLSILGNSSGFSYATLMNLQKLISSK
jgi:hypothetical protein